MNMQDLIATATKLMADDKGLLAIDESIGTCDKRFAKLGIPQTPESRRAYRELIVTTAGLGESISGVILFDETIRQQKKDGTPLVDVVINAGMVPGIKVDTGAKELAAFPGEKITEGLDQLRGRLKEYFQMGARFAKWRAVFALRRESSHPRLYRSQCAGAGPLRRSLPGSRTRPGGRAGIADGRLSYSGALPGIDRRGIARGLQPSSFPASGIGGYDSETQHDSAGSNVSPSRGCGRSSRRNREVSLARPYPRRSRASHSYREVNPVNWRQPV